MMRQSSALVYRALQRDHVMHGKKKKSPSALLEDLYKEEGAKYA